MLNNLDLTLLIPAFLCGLLVISTHVPLGLQVLKRGIIFIDLAIAQIAGLGALIANLYWLGEHQTSHLATLKLQFSALSLALLASAALTWTEKHWPQIQEALIGACFIISASIALLLVANHPHGGEHIRELLTGQILWINYQQVITTALIYSTLLILWFSLSNRYGNWFFYITFAIAITTSVQLVGVYLVFAHLVLPAIAVYKLAENKKLPFAYLTSIIGLIIGLITSIYLDWPTGPTIVVALTLSSMLFTVIYKTNTKKPNS